MQREELILAKDFCSYYQVEQSFVYSLQHIGLLEITSLADTDYIAQRELQKLEKIIRLHQDLDINLEGIDAIAHLLEKIDCLQSEVLLLKSRLRIYEEF